MIDTSSARVSMMPRLAASRASSDGVQCDTGTPLCDGCSRANAMMAATCSGVNSGGAPGRSSSMSIPMMSFSRSLSDASRFSAVDAQLVGLRLVGSAFRGQQNDATPLHQPLRRCLRSGERLEYLSLP